MTKVKLFVDRIAELEERLARLEEAVKLIQFDNDIEPEKPVTDEKCRQCLNPNEKGICTCKNTDKPSEFISIPRELANEWVSYGYSDVDNGSKVFYAIKRVL